ncbi:hypothetical protein FA13DRAFT_1813922 [Coprinellus micaceus]|uniref:Uncharacterized protein n=1 Tax=Coprinellus micaceus TaxID=71717 RepID=A0A4Y7TC57_COPMI|nr:hypothetical protein FA13DRAFT_1813922 [Coprinellus micaceus]
MNSNAAFQLFCIRHANMIRCDPWLEALFHPDSLPTLWGQTSSDAKLLWDAEASGSVPFPSYELTHSQRDRIIPFNLWRDHHIMALREMTLPVEPFDQHATHVWEMENTDVKGYWALKASAYHNEINERERHIALQAQLVAEASLSQRLQLTDVDREYYFQSGCPSETCEANQESLGLKLWECPGMKLGVCAWKGVAARDILRHIECVHGVVRLSQ